MGALMIQSIIEILRKEQKANVRRRFVLRAFCESLMRHHMFLPPERLWWKDETNPPSPSVSFSFATVIQLAKPKPTIIPVSFRYHSSWSLKRPTSQRECLLKTAEIAFFVDHVKNIFIVLFVTYQNPPRSNWSSQLRLLCTTWEEWKE